LSKTVHCTTFSLWSEFLTLPFVRFKVKQKALLGLVKISDERGVEQAFVLAVRSKEKVLPRAAGRRAARSAKRLKEKAERA
jgi:hypothetical protein